MATPSHFLINKIIFKIKIELVIKWKAHEPKCEVHRRIHFLNFNIHDKDLSSFPVQRPTWAHLQDTK